MDPPAPTATLPAGATPLFRATGAKGSNHGYEYKIRGNGFNPGRHTRVT